MLCEKCNKNEATVFYRENVNGHKKSYALCKECAEACEAAGEIGKLGFEEDFWSSHYSGMDSIFKGLFGQTPYLKKSPAQAKKCSLCGAVFSELVSDGKVGCPECYKTFADELASTISRIHGSCTHIGDSPEKYKAGREKKERIASLEKRLKEALETEEYEKAAELRDELRAVKSENPDA